MGPAHTLPACWSRAESTRCASNGTSTCQASLQCMPCESFDGWVRTGPLNENVLLADAREAWAALMPDRDTVLPHSVILNAPFGLAMQRQGSTDLEQLKCLASRQRPRWSERSLVAFSSRFLSRMRRRTVSSLQQVIRYLFKETAGLASALKYCRVAQLLMANTGHFCAKMTLGGRSLRQPVKTGV
jgi:hypothetical protein